MRWTTASPPGSNRPIPTRTPSSSRTRAPPNTSTTTPSRSWTATATCCISAPRALSVIGSIFAGIYTKVTRIAPEKASELATAILDIGERIEHANSLDALEALQDELEAILRGAVIGLRDGTISSDGLDTFKLGYEFVRDEIGMRRDHLKRHAGHEDNVVVVKTAQSA